MSRHVFVCGFPRSGATVLYDMLRATVTNFRFLGREMPARRVIGATREEYVTVRPLDILDVDRIMAANTSGKDVACIVAIRDIRDLVTARHDGVSDAYCISFDHQYFVRKGTLAESDRGIQQIHNSIVRTMQRRDLTTVRVRYEDLLRDGDAVQARLGHRIGFAYGGAFRDMRRNEPPVGPRRAPSTIGEPDPAPIESWRAAEHRERIIDHFSRWSQLFRLLKMHGYESDDRWFDAYIRDELTSAS